MFHKNIKYQGKAQTLKSCFQFLWLNHRKMLKISIIRSFKGIMGAMIFFYIKIEKLTVICGWTLQVVQPISPDMPCDPLYNYCSHMRWISKVVSPRVVDFPKDNNLSRVDNVMFISYEGINCFIIPKLSSKGVYKTCHNVLLNFTFCRLLKLF
jgi:hypothetical protein